MSRRRALLNLSIVACAFAGAALAIPSLSAASGSSATTYLTGDCQHSTVKPKEVVLFCGDGNYIFTGLTDWQRWGQSAAEASGTMSVNQCMPNCAASKPVPVKAILTVSQAKVCGASRHRQYTRWLVTVIGKPPKGVFPNSSGTFVCK